MYPIDFEEFLLNIGINENIIVSLRDSFLKNKSVDDFVHKKIMELFRLYLIVGGMPAAVTTYLKNNDLQEVLLIQKNIIQLYKRDISQYGDVHPGLKTGASYC